MAILSSLEFASGIQENSTTKKMSTLIIVAFWRSDLSIKMEKIWNPKNWLKIPNPPKSKEIPEKAKNRLERSFCRKILKCIPPFRFICESFPQILDEILWDARYFHFIYFWKTWKYVNLCAMTINIMNYGGHFISHMIWDISDFLAFNAQILTYF